MVSPFWTKPLNFASVITFSSKLSAPISDPTNKLNIPREIMICFAEVSLEETAKIGHYGLYFETWFAEYPEFVKTIISLASISYAALTAQLQIVSAIDSCKFYCIIMLKDFKLKTMNHTSEVRHNLIHSQCEVRLHSKFSTLSCKPPHRIYPYEFLRIRCNNQCHHRPIRI